MNDNISPQKSTYREIYESQNDCSISGVSIKINCENHLNHSNNSSNLNGFQLASSSAQSSSSLLDNQIIISQNNQKSFKAPQLISSQPNASDDDIIELPENVEYPAQEPLVIRGTVIFFL